MSWSSPHQYRHRSQSNLGRLLLAHGRDVRASQQHTSIEHRLSRLIAIYKDILLDGAGTVYHIAADIHIICANIFVLLHNAPSMLC